MVKLISLSVSSTAENQPVKREKDILKPNKEDIAR